MRGFMLCSLVAGVLGGGLATAAMAGGYTDASYLTPVGTVGQPYSHRVEWKPGNGCPPYSYAVVSGDFPAGLSLSASGELTGVPTREGTFSFYIRQTDLCGPEGEGNSPFGITIGAFARLPLAEVRIPYAVSLASVLGPWAGVAPFRYQSVGGFPFGIGIDTGAGTIFGSPRTPGLVTLSLRVLDANHKVRPVTVALMVVPRLRIARQALPRPRVGRSYRAALTVSGGNAPVIARISSGALPAGLRLSPTTGIISGVPRRSGPSRFTLSIRDSLGASASTHVTLSVSATAGR